MNQYSDQILGPSPYVEDSDPFYTQMEPMEKEYRKLKKREKGKKSKRKKKLKKLEKQLQMLVEDYQQFKELEKKRHKEKKGMSEKELEERVQVLELKYQQQQQWIQDVMSNALINLLRPTAGSMNLLPPQSQPIYELPAPRDQR